MYTGDTEREGKGEKKLRGTASKCFIRTPEPERMSETDIGIERERGERPSAGENEELCREFRCFSWCEECLALISAYCSCTVALITSLILRSVNAGTRGKIRMHPPTRKTREEHTALNQSPSICLYVSTSSYSIALLYMFLNEDCITIFTYLLMHSDTVCSYSFWLKLIRSNNCFVKHTVLLRIKGFLSIWSCIILLFILLYVNSFLFYFSISKSRQGR